MPKACLVSLSAPLRAYGVTNVLFDPRQSLVRINAGHGSLPFASRISRSAMVLSARYKPARNTQGVSPTRSANTVPSWSSRFKRGANKFLWDLEQLLGRRYQIVCRQAAMTLVHGLAQCIGNPP